MAERRARQQHFTDEAAVAAWLADGAIEPATVHGVDLRALDRSFADVGLARCVFLGCRIGPVLAGAIASQGAGILSEQPALPASLPAFRHGLYAVGELYQGMDTDGSGWERTPDHEGCVFFNEGRNTPRQLTPAQLVAARLHDTVQEHAVRAFLKQRDVVAIMGGHDFQRQMDPAATAPDVYWECVRIAKTLTERGFLILTGGGPGVMEAGNLGALLAGESDDLVEEIRVLLPNCPFESTDWRATAMRARARVLNGAWDNEPPPAKWSVGMPTWLYGHEPPNLFASHHCKMFFNSLREDGLVTLANKGIIFFEGNAGTVQEIFQDATQNYYLGPGQSPTPMVFYNAGGYWDRPCDESSRTAGAASDRRKPLLPLIRQLAIEKNFERSVFVTDSAGAVVDFLVGARGEPQVHKADVKLGNAPAARPPLERDL